VALDSDLIRELRMACSRTRATACLLAVMHGVPEFGHALLGELGAPRSPSVDTFAEVRFKNADGKTDIPDGAIVCERGSKGCTCLVEVKTGSAVRGTLLCSGRHAGRPCLPE
jgi:hypothetical protein